MKAYVSKRRVSKISEMLPEYDFTSGVRGKHYRSYRRGHTVRIKKTNGTIIEQHFTLKDGAVMLEPGVQRYFPDSESVNEALRTLIKLIPKRRRFISNTKTRN